MAVTYKSVDSVVVDDSSVSETLNIHADSKIVVLLMTAWGGTNWLDPSDFTWGGVSFTNLVDTDSQNSNQQVWIGYLVNPATGNQTFAGSLGESRNVYYCVLGYDEVDTSSPITDSDSETSNDTDITGLTAGASDMMVGIAARSDAAPTVTDSSQTQRLSGADSGVGIGVAEKAAATGFYYSNAYYSTCAAAVLRYAAASIEQEGFRWRKDDGSESGAGWHQNQDVDHTGFAKETNIRLRFLLNGTGDPSSKQFNLQYKKTADSNYLDMPETDTPPDLTIEAGDTTEDNDANTTLTTHTIDLPAYADGDLVIINIGFWQDNNDDTDMSFPAGPNSETLTVLETGYGGTGDVDAAMLAIAWFIGDGADAGSTISVTSNNGSRTSSAMIVVPAGEFDPSKPLSTALDKDFSSSDSSSPNFGAFSANSDDAGGKLVVFLNVDQDEVTTVPSGFTEWQQEDVGRASSWLGGRDTNVTASESISAAPSSWGGVNDAWAIYAYIVRPAPHHFHLSASSQFADGATTAQLAAPSGKTTGDFDAGQITEDDNPITSVDITEDDYTEIEFCFQATSDADEVQYDFRIEGLDTYTVTPQLTISSGYTPTAVIYGPLFGPMGGPI